jgi:hypothetical protein
MSSIEFPNDLQQLKVRAHVILKNPMGSVILNRKHDVWEGEPIGDWCDFRGIRIALRRIEGMFEGIVPDRGV